jgi:ParB family chromosome partitioning protein
MGKKKQVLGTSLSDLIPVNPEGTVEAKPSGKPLYINISDIVKNPDQPRKIFEERELEKLVSSIREKGILEPLIVFETETGYQLVAGQRRLMAAERAGLTTVPVFIREQKGELTENLELALIENILRQDLNPIEEAEAFETLEKQYGKDAISIGKLVGKDSSTIKNSIRLLKLPEVVKNDVMEGRLTAGHGRALLSFEDFPEELLKVRSKALSDSLTVRQIEALAKKFLKPKNKRQSRMKEEEEAYYASLSSEISKSLNGLKVVIFYQGRNKKIVINYHSNENIELILKKLNIEFQ